MADKPLQGIRVADFTHILAGPYCTLLMAMAGADVIHIQSLTQEDISTRPPAAQQDPASARQGKDPNSTAMFNTVNLNKRAIRLDLHRSEAVALAKNLVRVSDVVVENFRPGIMDRLGLGYKELYKVRPDIIMVSISMTGQEGPEHRYGGAAVNFSALSGMGYLTSYADGIPTEVRAPMDTTDGTSACFAVLAALMHRKATGEGQYIDVSAREAVTSFLGDIFLDYPLNQRDPQPMGNGHSYMAPHGVYPCKEEDSWIAIAVGNDAEWRSLCRAMSRPDLLDEVYFKDALVRWQHREKLDALLADWTRSFADVELIAYLQEAGVAAMPSFSNKELYEDRHLKERRVYHEVNHPELGRKIVLGPPFLLTDTPLDVHSPAPLLGQHNEQVFCDLLGLPREELERLIKEQVIF